MDIRNIIIIVAVACVLTVAAYYRKKISEYKKNLSKQKNMVQLQNIWIRNIATDKNISEYFTKNKLYKIGIYGMGTLGELTVKELLKCSDINIECVIESLVDGVYYEKNGIPVVGLDNTGMINRSDVIVVTPINEFNNIKTNLENKGCNLKIVSLEEVIRKTGV